MLRRKALVERGKLTRLVAKVATWADQPKYPIRSSNTGCLEASEYLIWGSRKVKLNMFGIPAELETHPTAAKTVAEWFGQRRRQKQPL